MRNETESPRNIRNSFAMWIIAVCLTAAAVASAEDVSLDIEQAVIIPDANLRAAIEDALGLDPGDPITEADMAGLITLTAHDSGIADLTGLEHAVNLEALWLDHNEISDLGPLSGLSTLRGLSFGANQLSGIAPLAGLGALEDLGLWQNDISDVSPLSGLTNLRSLSLSDNDIADLMPLADLNELRLLHVANNNVSDLDPLTDLTELRELHIAINAVTDLGPLGGLTALETLHAWSNDISDITPLAGLTSLQDLNLVSNQVADVSALEGLTALVSLHAWGNEISDITPLKDLTALRELHLSQNLITDITPIASLTLLEQLWVSGMQLDSIEPLTSLTNLRVLDLGSSGLEDISALAGLVDLEELVVSENNLKDIDVVSGMTSLLTLEIQWNNIESLEPLSGTTGLTLLNAGHNQISDLSPLQDLDNLVHVEIRDNLVTEAGPLLAMTNLQSTNLSLNPLSQNACDDVDTLILAGVDVVADTTCEFPVFPDANLEQAVRDVLGVPERELTNADLFRLNELHAAENGISDLTGLEYAVNLRVLNLGQNAIGDVAPLAGLTQLRHLDLTSNAIGAQSAPPWHTNGNDGEGLLFNGGTTWVEIADTYTDPDELAVAAWVFIPGGADDRQTILWSGAGWDRKGIYFEVLGSGLTRQAVFQLGDGGAEVRVPGGEVRANEWTHIVGQWADGEVEYYINGEHVFSAPWETGYHHNPDFPVQIGAARDQDENLGRFFQGFIQEVAMFDRALTEAEIQEVMLGIDGAEAGLGGYWRLDEGEGSVAFDASPSQNDGTIHGGQWAAFAPGGLAPLAWLTELRVLHLGGNVISDVTPLAGLTNLEHLSLWGNWLTDISALADLVNLRALSINDNDIDNIEVIANFTQLRHLPAYRNDINDIAPLEELHQLRILNLNHNSFSSVEPLAGLTQLEVLGVADTLVTDLSPLAGLTNLWGLHIFANDISDISMLGDMTQMRVFSAGENNISDIGVLANMPLIQELWLHINEITDISVLEEMEALALLALHRNFINDITPLVNNSGLGPNRAIVSLSHNPITGTACQDLDTLVVAGVDLQADGVCPDPGFEPPLPTTYQVVNLGVPAGYESSQALAINDRGQITGLAEDGAGESTPFFWMVDSMELLPTLDGPVAEGWAINEAGHIAGTLEDGDGRTWAFLWDGQDAHILGERSGAPANASQWVWDMNEYGQIVLTEFGGTLPQAVLWQPDEPNAATGEFVHLGAMGGGGAEPYAINRFGEVTGRARRGDGSIHTFLWVPDERNAATGAMTNMAPTDARSSEAWGLNSHGNAVGRLDFPGEAGFAFFFDGAAKTNLGDLAGTDSIAFDINDYAQAVGASSAGGFIWDAANGMQDLNAMLEEESSKGWHIASAHAISNNGWIVGQGLRNGEPRAFLLRPITGDADGRSFNLGMPAELLDDAFYEGESLDNTDVAGRAAFAAALSNSAKRVAFWGVNRDTEHGALFTADVGVFDSWQRITPYIGATPNTLPAWTPDGSAVIFDRRLIPVNEGLIDPLPDPLVLHGIELTEAMDPTMTSRPDDNWLFVNDDHRILALPILRDGAEDPARGPVVVADFDPATMVGLVDWTSATRDGNRIAFVDKASSGNPGVPDVGRVYVLDMVLDILAAAEPAPGEVKVSPLAPEDVRVDPLIRRIRTNETVNFAWTPAFSADGRLVYFSEDWRDIFTETSFFTTLALANFDVMVANSDGSGIAFRVSIPDNRAMATAARSGSTVVYMQAPPDNPLAMRLYGAGIETSRPIQGEQVGDPAENTVKTTEPQIVEDGTETSVNIPGETTVTFPPNVPQEVRITTPIEPVQEAEMPDDVDGLPVLREFGPPGTTFDPPITITITYTDDEIEGLDEENLRIFLYNEETGTFDTEVTSQIIERDLENNRIVFEVNHFSIFALGGSLLASEPVLGDVTGDGEVTSADLQAVINAVLGQEIDPLYNPDVNNDGTVDGRDIQIVILVLLGLL